MKYFKFIGNINITAALEEVEKNKSMFAPHTPKPEQSPPLREGRSIHLRIHDHSSKSADISAFKGAKEMADKMLEAVDSPLMPMFPECKKLIELGMSKVPEGSILGRCYIAKMIPGGTVYPHIDPGKYFDLHDRYHIVLKTNPGVSFSCGDESIANDVETVRFEAGEFWVFNNKVMHWASNRGDDDRIHIIMDVRNDTLQFN
jgi:Aspartyl/Asparaginyl beta-hydroxylase